MKEWGKTRQWLVQEKDRIKSELEQMEGEEGEGPSLQEEVAELSVVDNHPADMGSENFERSKDHSLKEKKIYLLQRVEAAIAKIDGGTYGFCERCGAEIGDERLQAVPYTLFCYHCQAEEEEGFDCDRPVEEELLENPFVKDRMENEARSDSEDFWQAAARHNERPGIYENGVEEEERGKTEKIEKISNEKYRDQLPE